MAQQSLEVLIKAIDGYSPTFGKFGNDLDTMKQKLSSLDSQFGESSNFGKMMKIMQGGGAAAGLNMAGRVLEDVTGKAIELRDALDAGEITAGEMADELARSVPILGNIYSAGANIHELITGAQAELRRTLSVEQSIEDANLMQVRHWREIQSQISAAADEIDKYNDRIIRAGLDAPGLARFDLGQKFEGEESAANTKRQKLIEDAKAQFEYLGDDPKNKGTSKAPASGTIRDLESQAIAQREIAKVGEIADASETPARVAALAKAKEIEKQIDQRRADLDAKVKKIEDDFNAASLLRKEAFGLDAQAIEKKLADEQLKERQRIIDELASLDDEAAMSRRAAMMAMADDTGRELMRIEDDFNRTIKNIAEDRKRLDELLGKGAITEQDAWVKKNDLTEREQTAGEDRRRREAEALAKQQADAAAERQRQLDSEIGKQNELTTIEKQRFDQIRQFTADDFTFKAEQVGPGYGSAQEQRQRLQAASMSDAWATAPQAAPSIPGPSSSSSASNAPGSTGDVMTRAQAAEMIKSIDEFRRSFGVFSRDILKINFLVME